MDNVIVNLDKPGGITSQQAVTKARKMLGARKAGHAGTLDPMATGVLLICLGEATKISRFLMDSDKEYVARMKLGEQTDTLDAEGAITGTLPIPDITVEDISAAVRQFTGKIRQQPPMYSAIKQQGTPLYALARKGITVDRPYREVVVSALRVKEFDPPFVDLIITCSAGTYIRTLCHDLGIALGTCAHLTALQRSRSGRFSVEKAASFEQLAGLAGIPGPVPFVSSIDEALSGFTEILLSENDYQRALNGVPVRHEKDLLSSCTPFVRLKSPSEELFGIGRVQETEISIERILKLQVERPDLNQFLKD